MWKCSSKFTNNKSFRPLQLLKCAGFELLKLSWLRVPGHPRQLLLAGFPLRTKKNTRRDLHQARSQHENARGVPRTTVSRAILADIQRVGHALERDVLHNQFGE